MKTLTVTDESAAGDILNKIALEFENEYITVEELIKTRIVAEVEQYKQDLEKYRFGLVKPTQLEHKLNKKKRREIDVEKQFYVALEAFQKNGFLVLVDDEQVVDLKQKFLFDQSTNVSFIKLTPLVGG